MERLRATDKMGQLLPGRALYCLFYEPSFITRASFERAIGMLGGVAYHTEDASRSFPVSTPKAVADADAIYLNGPSTAAHLQLLQARNGFNLRIDSAFMEMLKPHCIVMNPMQRGAEFVVEVKDGRLAFYRQSENALFARIAVLYQMLGG